MYDAVQYTPNAVAFPSTQAARPATTLRMARLFPVPGPHDHEKTQMAGGERLCEGIESLIAFDNDGITRDMFRLGHPPILPVLGG